MRMRVGDKMVSSERPNSAQGSNSNLRVESGLLDSQDSVLTGVHPPRVRSGQQSNDKEVGADPRSAINDTIVTDVTVTNVAIPALESGTQTVYGASSLPVWDGDDDPARPQNWTRSRKWKAVSIVSYFTFISPVASSIIAPSLPDIGRDLGIENDSEKSLCLTIFVLGFAFGPLLLAPLSEIYGRSIVLQISNLVFLAFNTCCGFTRSGPQLIAFRMVSGIGGSAPLAIGPALLADLFSPDERGTAAAIYSFIPIMGPALGPLCGGFIADYSTWRWGFWATSILAVPIQFLAYFLLEETYAPVLLSRRKDKKTKKIEAQSASTVGLDRLPVLTELRDAMLRPVRMMFTQTIIIVMGLYQAYLYGLMYIVLTTFPTLWREEYHQSVSVGGLNYISLGLGYCIGLQVSGRLQDAIYRSLKYRHDGTGQPEFRIPLLLPVSLLILPLGFLIYGWSAAHKLHWIVPNIGAFIFAAGIMMGFNALVTYVIDSYPTYAASATAATAILRGVAAFMLPLGAAEMYEKLGWGWGNTLLGMLAVGVGAPAAVGVWVLGPTLRARSTFASA